MKFRAAIPVLLACWVLSACETIEGTFALGVIGAAIIGVGSVP